MSLHRPLYAVAAAALMAAAGCSSVGSSSVTPFAAPASKLGLANSRPLPNAAHNYVYVGDAYSNAVWIFPAAGLNPNPVGSITNGVGGPQGVAIDKSGALYVTNPNHVPPTVTIYPAGSTAPSLTLSQDLTVPAAVAVDSKGNVWVSNEEGGFTGSVVEFPPGHTTPSTVISGLNPYGVAVDSKRNLYVENYNTTAAYVSVYRPGSTKPKTSFGSKDLLEPLGITIGPTGDVYVCDFYYNEVFIYAPGTYKLLKKVLVPTGFLAALTLAQNTRLYTGDASQAVVSEISNYGFGKVLPNRFHNDLQSAFGVAADPAVAPGP